MNRFALLVCVLTLPFLLLATGCKSNAAVGTWEIEEYTLAGKTDDAKIGSELTFTDDGHVSGFMKGTYTVEGDVVTVKTAAFEVELKLKDGKLISENPASKIVYKRK